MFSIIFFNFMVGEEVSCFEVLMSYFSFHSPAKHNRKPGKEQYFSSTSIHERFFRIRSHSSHDHKRHETSQLNLHASNDMGKVKVEIEVLSSRDENKFIKKMTTLNLLRSVAIAGSLLFPHERHRRCHIPKRFL